MYACKGADFWQKNQLFSVEQDPPYIVRFPTDKDSLILSDGCRYDHLVNAIRSLPLDGADDGVVHFVQRASPPVPGAVLDSVSLSFKYNIGYCGRKGGAGLKLIIKGDVIYDTGTRDEPAYDESCGGCKTCYANVTINVDGLSMILPYSGTDVMMNFTSTGRNMEIVLVSRAQVNKVTHVHTVTKLCLLAFIALHSKLPDVTA
jgi:hypothetical protein